MTSIPDAAIEAAAEAFAARCGCGEPKFHIGYARTAAEAFEPAFREHIAQEILAMDDRPEGRMMHSCAIEAARIVRGGDA